MAVVTATFQKCSRRKMFLAIGNLWTKVAKKWLSRGIKSLKCGCGNCHDLCLHTIALYETNSNTKAGHMYMDVSESQNFPTIYMLRVCRSYSTPYVPYMCILKLNALEPLKKRTLENTLPQIMSIHC
jgi:hypothetical protein